jgi:hypothetical protein
MLSDYSQQYEDNCVTFWLFIVDYEDITLYITVGLLTYGSVIITSDAG